MTLKYDLAISRHDAPEFYFGVAAILRDARKYALLRIRWEDVVTYTPCHVSRDVTHTSAACTNSSVSCSMTAPSRRATACEGRFSRSMQWMMRSISKVANTQLRA